MNCDSKLCFFFNCFYSLSSVLVTVYDNQKKSTGTANICNMYSHVYVGTFCQSPQKEGARHKTIFVERGPHKVRSKSFPAPLAKQESFSDLVGPVCAQQSFLQCVTAAGRCLSALYCKLFIAVVSTQFPFIQILHQILMRSFSLCNSFNFSICVNILVAQQLLQNFQGFVIKCRLFNE